MKTKTGNRWRLPASRSKLPTKVWPRTCSCAKADLCYNARSSSTLMFPQQASRRLCGGGCVSRTFRSPITDHRSRKQRERVSAFTLLELLIVVGIIALLLVLMAPAFTNLKSAGDVTNSIYGIRGLLENARTYAKANHTYVFVGFAEVDSSADPSVSPQLPGNGRVAVAVVASKDGARHFQYAISGQGSDWQLNYGDPSKPEYHGGHLVAISKLERYENLHFLVDFGSWPPGTHPNSNMARNQPTGTFYTLGNAGSVSQTPFSWPLGSALDSGQYQFNKVISFDPQGIARITGSGNADEIARVMEIDFQPTHGTTVPPPPTDQDVGNQAAIQIAPMSGAVRVYRP